uniref:Uncharacterized protein n=1 Tax=Oryza sativa subsp. japonica TaxID=39947 RepID=Q69SX7_ORYSJ|nr:hypothetical protein [Oryza sativa Japonica Group]BAD35955.1 hypothetical protein [Oryza sativa Japonica Group]
MEVAVCEIISRTPMEVVVREIATYWFEDRRMCRIISRTPMEVGGDDSAFVEIILDNGVCSTTTYTGAQLFLKNIF